MISFNSYSKIYSLGQRATRTLLDSPVLCEEKVDGSQFSFGVDEEGTFHCRSKGAVMIPDAPEKMFAAGVKALMEIKDQLRPGWTYRGEYLAKPKHNVLVYDRIPIRNVIIFDIARGLEDYLSRQDKEIECERLGLECVPMLFAGVITLDKFRELLQTQSVLGGQKIEGVVVKPYDYNIFDQDKKILMGKFVSEEFKEAHSGEWKQQNPGPADVITLIAAQYTTQARWQKAVQHLREACRLTDSPKDIGPLINEIKQDIESECMDEIKEALFKQAWPQIQRRVVIGAPEWYKEQLLKLAFEDPKEVSA